MTTTAPASVPNTRQPFPVPTSGVGNWSALAVLMAGTFVIILDFFIGFVIAAPHTPLAVDDTVAYEPTEGAHHLL